MDVFSGLVGAMITGLIMLYVNYFPKRREGGLSNYVIGKIKCNMTKKVVPYFIAKSSRENYNIVRDIYLNSDAEIIGTAFYEDPAKYINDDLIKFVKNKKDFIRIVDRKICSVESEAKIRDMFLKYGIKSKLIILEDASMISKLDGIYCRMYDGTYLCFMSLKNPYNDQYNKGIVFSGEIAERYYDYFLQIVIRNT